MVSTLIEDFRNQFAALRDNDGCFFDSASTTLMPDRVVRAMGEALGGISSVHRAGHEMAEIATEAYEAARARIALAIGAAPDEISFVANASWAMAQAAQLLRNSCSVFLYNPSDHHSTILAGTDRFSMVPMKSDSVGVLDLENIPLDKITAGAVVAVSQISNVTGLATPVSALAQITRDRGAILMIDGCQAYPHKSINVRELGCDVFVFSPHKAFGPPGVGVLYISASLRDRIDPWPMAGGTVEKVTSNGFIPRSFPHCLEAGTPNVPGAIAAARAAEFLGQTRQSLAIHFDQICDYLRERLVKQFDVLGAPDRSSSVPIFTIKSSTDDAESIARLLSRRYNIGVRGGSHCAHQFFDQADIGGGVRISPYYYNTIEECERLLIGLRALIH